VHRRFRHQSSQSRLQPAALGGTASGVGSSNGSGSQATALPAIGNQTVGSSTYPISDCGCPYTQQTSTFGINSEGTEVITTTASKGGQDGIPSNAVDRVTATLGAEGFLIEHSGGTLGNNGKVYLSGWRGGSRARITTSKGALARVGKALGILGILVGSGSDAYLVFSGQESRAKAGVNLSVGMIGLLNPGGGALAVGYGLSEAFYPGGAEAALDDYGTESLIGQSYDRSWNISTP
jgi:hypothetical protein